MTKFDNEWIKFIHCLLWRLGEVDEWVFHKILYELSKENVIEINNWAWYGEWPRSSLVDAVIALFTMSGVIKRESDKLIIKREPRYECVFEDRVEKIISNSVSKYCSMST